jgi:hypothetical protein
MTPAATTVNREAPDPVQEGAAMRRLVEAIADEVWVLYGREGTLNWASVERHLRAIVDRARFDVVDCREDRAVRDGACNPGAWSGGLVALDRG